jgi:hypothetical protein
MEAYFMLWKPNLTPWKLFRESLESPWSLEAHLSHEAHPVAWRQPPSAIMEA